MKQYLKMLVGYPRENPPPRGPGKLAVIKKYVGPESTHIDVGAGRGLTAALLVADTGIPAENCILVEACPVNCTEIGRTNPQFRGLNVAVGSVRGEATFYVINEPGDPGTSTSNTFDYEVLRKKYPHADIQERQVEVVTMSDIFDKEQVSWCDLLSFNCEGSEYDIFTADLSFLQRVGLLQLDLHWGNYGGRSWKQMIALKKRIVADVIGAGFELVAGHDLEHLDRCAGHLSFLFCNRKLSGA